MNTTAWRSRDEARLRPRRAGLASMLVALTMVACVGCGGDDADGDSPSGEQAMNPVGGGSGSGRRMSKSEDFIAACLDESDHECTEYLGEEGMRAEIEAEAKDVCRLDANMLQTTRCSASKRVGRCRNGVIIDNTEVPFDIYYYEPVKLEDAKLLCRGGAFTPGG